MSWVKADTVPAAKAVAPSNATLTIQPQHMKTMPCTSFVLPVNLTETRLSDVMDAVAKKLAAQARAFPHASAQFNGDVSALKASVPGFLFEDMGGGMVVARGTAVPPSQHSNTLDLIGIRTSGSTLHVAHSDDVQAALQSLRMFSAQRAK